jgi:hypothetical protein
VPALQVQTEFRKKKGEKERNEKKMQRRKLVASSLIWHGLSYWHFGL